MAKVELNPNLNSDMTDWNKYFTITPIFFSAQTIWIIRSDGFLQALHEIIANNILLHLDAKLVSHAPNSIAWPCVGQFIRHSPDIERTEYA